MPIPVAQVPGLGWAGLAFGPLMTALALTIATMLSAPSAVSSSTAPSVVLSNSYFMASLLMVESSATSKLAALVASQITTPTETFVSTKLPFLSDLPQEQLLLPLVASVQM